MSDKPPGTLGINPVDDESILVDALISRARAAMVEYATADQARVDEVVTAVAWSLYNPKMRATWRNWLSPIPV